MIDLHTHTTESDGRCTAAELVAVAVIGTVLSQAAFAAGPLVESLPVSTVLEPAIGRACSAIVVWIDRGIETAMSQFNAAEN